VNYPLAERCSAHDIMPGLLFAFTQEPAHPGVWGSVQVRSPPFDDERALWLVIHKELAESNLYRYLLLTDSVLYWYEGNLGWIRRIADPGCEERDARLAAEARGRELELMLGDDAVALST